MVHVMYNPTSCSGNGMQESKKIEQVLTGCEFVYDDVTKLEDYDKYIAGIPAEDKIVLSGGDGTLFYYINHTTEETRKRPIAFFATGTGNDFVRDLPEVTGQYIEDVSEFMTGLPTVTVNGKSYRFINGVGFGIDGYCCVEGERLRKVSDKPVNYAGIAIKGILFSFKPFTATITVDGKETVLKHSWLAPAMYGRFYGGGMMAAPGQDRRAKDKTLTTMIFHTAVPLHALIVFPKIFSGDHVNSKIVSVMSGKTISVKFDRPCALQIDGEAFENITEYTATVE